MITWSLKLRRRGSCVAVGLWHSDKLLVFVENDCELISTTSGGICAYCVGLVIAS